MTRCVTVASSTPVSLSTACLPWLWCVAACGGAPVTATPETPVATVAVGKSAQDRLPLLPFTLGDDQSSNLPSRSGTAAIVPPGSPPPGAMGWCLRSRMCELEGMCTPSEGDLCIAASDSDCESSKACLGGRCSARGGLCVAADDEDCRESWACKGYGRCHFDGKDACMATSDEECRASTRCIREGECLHSGGACVK